MEGSGGKLMRGSGGSAGVAVASKDAEVGVRGW
jgi:hypothetical protein